MARNNSHRFLDKKTGREITYIDLENLKIAHPDGRYNIIGEIETKADADGGTVIEILESDIKLNIQPIGTYKENKYKTIGFIPCADDGYIAVKKKKHTRLIGGLLAALMVITLLLGGYFLMNNNSGIDPNAVDYESQLKRPDNIDSSKILIPGYGKFTLDKGSDTIDTVLFNPEGNPCYFKFSLVEKSSGNVLYESGLVAPGKGIMPIKLNKTFNDTGTYPLILKFQTVDFEDTDITYNGSDIEVDLNVVE